MNKWEVEEIENIDLDDASEKSEYKMHASAIMAIVKSL